MRRLPPLNAIRAFEATARLSSVTAAANELSVSHSAVSQQIRQLEDYFGQKLFLRPGRKVEPTPAALSYLEDVRAALDRISVASDRLTENWSRRDIMINSTPSFALKWLIPHTAAFQIDNPDIQLRITTSSSDTIEQLQLPHDFIVRRDVMVKEGYICRRLLSDVSTPVLSPALAERITPKVPADLVRCPLLHARLRPDAWRSWFDLAGVDGPATVGGSFLDNIFLGIEAAINGVGATIAPLVMVEDDVAAGRLVVPFPDIALERPGFYILFRTDWAKERASRKFLQWLERETGAPLFDAEDEPNPGQRR